MRTVITAIIIRDKKILLVRKKQTWILPGGKPEPGETAVACLIRELEEELPGLILIDTASYKNFQGRSPHRKDIIRIKTYFAKIYGIFIPSAEINAAEWINNFDHYTISDATQKCIESLKKDGYL